MISRRRGLGAAGRGGSVVGSGDGVRERWKMDENVGTCSSLRFFRSSERVKEEGSGSGTSSGAGVALRAMTDADSARRVSPVL